MAKKAFLFPGQGAQHVGMGQELYQEVPEARALFDRAEKRTSLPLTRLCFEGPEEELARTDHAQPAIFTVSAALLVAMEQKLSPGQLEERRPDAMAGLSLGEYTALYAAGAADFDDMLGLVTRRGQLMQEAATARPSAMVAILGIDSEDSAMQLCDACAQGQILKPANFNCPGQIVLSGQVEACERAAQRAGQFGASGAKMLNVAGAFHSEIMAPAAEKFSQALEAVSFRLPDGEVWANVDAQPYRDVEEIPRKLLAQLTGAVRWQQSMESLLAGGVEDFYEIGPGKTLAGIMRRIERKRRVKVINDLSSVASLAGQD
jgi:[acyl-carrier-protein] S-malonyltransferase